MLAAGFAAQNGKRTILLEKNPVLGKKLLITGKGRCNITNNCEIPDLIENTPRNGKFLINAFYQFNSYDTISFFSDLGLEVKIERGNRVFPVSDKAQDVVKSLIKFIHKTKVEVYHSAVESVLKFGSLFAAKLINGEVVRTEKLVIATGGKSYPATGSTGDGYKFARTFGHKITRFQPSLVPIEAKQFHPANPHVRVPALSGLVLKNVAIKVKRNNGKVVYSDFGEMEFANNGISGPIILSASAHLSKLAELILEIDLKPALDEEKLDLRLQREFKANPQKQYKTVLKNLLPGKMIPVIIILSEIPAAKKAGQITREERYKLRYLLKHLAVKLEKFRPLQEAIITRGGVDVKEIDPKTMKSKLVPGLYFAGEIIDCDAYTGGFNLQIAWSTGFAAGNST